MSSQLSLKLPSGFQMPAFGLGTWQASDPKQLEDALNTALEVGYRHIDTALAYENEAVIGKVLKEWFSAGKLKREDVFVTTKLPPSGVHPDRVHSHFETSFANLGLAYIDLYLIHLPIGFNKVEGEEGWGKMEGKTDHAAIWRKMEDLVASGRVRSIGLSNYNISQIETVLKTAKVKPSNLQVELHLYLQQKELVDFCHKNGITVVSYASLGSPGYNTFMRNTFGAFEKELPDILNNSVVSRIAKKHKKNNAQVALRFLLQRGISVIPKSVNPKRVQDNFKVFDFELDDQDIQDLLKLDVGQRIVNFDILPGVDKHPDFPFQ